MKSVAEQATGTELLLVSLRSCSINETHSYIAYLLAKYLTDVRHLRKYRVILDK
jgi:hypothetical protein